MSRGGPQIEKKNQIKHQKTKKYEMQQVAHQDIYWSPEYEVFLYDSQQPSHKNDLLCQTQQDYNLHTRNPDDEDIIKIWLIIL